MNETTPFTPPLITVKKIKTLSLFIDEYNIAPNAVFKVDFTQQFSIDAQADVVNLVLKVGYSVDNEVGESRSVLDCSVQNIFELSKLKEYLRPDGKITIPDEILINIVSLAITHTRALLSAHISGTVFQDTLIPVINPAEATTIFFKDVPDHTFVPFRI